MASNLEQGQSSSTFTRPFPAPVFLRNDKENERFFILNRYGEGPSVVHPFTGPTGGIPVYRAIKVRGEATEETNVNNLVVSLKCLYARDGAGSPLENPALHSQFHEEKGNSQTFNSLGSSILEVTSSFMHTGRDDEAQFECIEFPYLREGSLYSFMNRRFPNGIPEDVIMYIIGQVVKAVVELHDTNRAHGQICAAHVFFLGGSTFKLVYAANNIDLDSDLGRCQVWRWAVAPEVYNHTVKINIPAEVLKTDVWMIGILALELAYSGLPFIEREQFYQKLEDISRNEKLPKNLLVDRAPQKKMNNLKNLIKGKKKMSGNRVFSKPFETFVLKCLEHEPALRPSARELGEDKLLAKFRITVPAKYSF